MKSNSSDIKPGRIKTYHVAIAAEAFAAGMFAQAGYDVSIQYGANQPDYDLIVKKSGLQKFLAISVKGSQDGGWGLLQSYKKGRTYFEAIDAWFENQGKGTIFCLVQLQGKKLGECPDVFLATPKEIADLLKTGRGGKGILALPMKKTYKKGVGKGQEFGIPESWRFGKERIEIMFK